MSLSGWIRREYQGIFLVILFSVALYLFIQPLGSGVVQTISPDEVVNQYFTKMYASDGMLAYPLPWEETAGEMLRPRGTVVTYDGYVAPSKFLGYPIFMGPLANMLGEDILPYLIPFFGALGLCVIYLLVKLEFGPKMAMISAPLVLFTPYYYWSTQYFYEDVLGLFFVLCGVYCSLLGSRSSDWVRTGIGGLCLGCAVIFKPFYLILLLPYLYIVLRNYRGYHLLLVIVPAVLGPLLFLTVNQYVYGDFLATGFHLQYGVEGEIIPVSSRSQLSLFLDNIQEYIWFLFPLSLLGSIGLFARSITKMEGRKDRWFDLYFLITALALIVYVLGISGAKDITSVHNSAIRYLLIINVLLIPYSIHLGVLLVKSLKIKKKNAFHAAVAIVLVAVLVIPGLSFLPAIERSEDDRIRYDYYNDYVTSRTNNGSIFICQYSDKYYFPDRLTGNPNYIVSDNKPLDAANISIALTLLGLDVYFVYDVKRDQSVFNMTAYEMYLSDMGYSLRAVVPQYGVCLVEINETSLG